MKVSEITVRSSKKINQSINNIQDMRKWRLDEVENRLGLNNS